MTLDNKKSRGALTDVLLALGINIAFLAFMLCFFAVRFETNDDVLMSKFVDGQMAEKTAFVPFINIALGWLLKILYTVGGDGFPWWSFCEYLLTLAGFTAVTWLLLRRFKLFPALVMTVFILSSFASDCYLSMNFSKPAAAGTVGGLALMLYAMRHESGRVQLPPLVTGAVMCVFAFLWRYEEFLICAAVMAGVGVCALAEIAGEHKGEKTGTVLRAMLRYAAPFLVLLVIVVGLFGVNLLAWNSDEYRDYYEFDWTRSILIDWYVPPYEQMSEVYDSLGMDETAVKLFETWNFYDTEKFTTESLQKVIDARAKLSVRPGLGECLGIFLQKCILGFYKERPLTGFLLMLALFLCAGKREASVRAGLGWMAVVFFAMYMFFIYTDRYLVNRIDIGIFMAMAVSLSWYLSPERLENEKLMLTALLLISLFVGWRSCRSVCYLDSHSEIDDKSGEKAAVDLILEDTEHLYFTKFMAIDHELYTPLETAPAGYGDRIISIGSWCCRHPAIERVLDAWGIENPYADIVGNDKVYIIDQDIDTTIKYIRKYYCPTAHAEKAEPLSSETGLMIYRIVE